MIDNDGNFFGVAAKEIEEEVGIKIAPEDLREIGSMDPSMGGCDEQIRLFRAELEVSPEHLDRLRRSLTGCLAEGEAITLRLRLSDEFHRAIMTGEINDAKAMCALFRSMPLKMT